MLNNFETKALMYDLRSKGVEVIDIYANDSSDLFKHFYLKVQQDNKILYTYCYTAYFSNLETDCLVIIRDFNNYINKYINDCDDVKDLFKDRDDEVQDLFYDFVESQLKNKFSFDNKFHFCNFDSYISDFIAEVCKKYNNKNDFLVDLENINLSLFDRYAPTNT